jgi:hypothetical protein
VSTPRASATAVALKDASIIAITSVHTARA